MNSEMNSEMMTVSVTTLLLKTLENATKEYARECIRRCAEFYGFESDEALLKLNLENNSSIQVKEMKKRSAAAVPKTKSLKEKGEKVVKEAVLKALCPFPFGTCPVLNEGCGGLTYNSGLFTQCQKERMIEGAYCKVCQKEADASASACPATGTVAQRLSLGNEFRCPKGRAPVAYMKVMQKLKMDREAVEKEAGKLNLKIDEIHFAVVEEKKEKAGRPKTQKKKVVSAETVEDLFAQLVVEDEDTETVIMTESEEEEEEDTREAEKMERNMMRTNEIETKKVHVQEEKSMKKAQQEMDKSLAKEKRIADELLAKEVKKQQLIDEKIAKEQKAIEDVAAKSLAKEQKTADELAAKLAREQKLIDDKAAREQKLIDDKVAKEQKIADELVAKALAKEQKVIDDLAAKAAKEQKAISDKAAKEQKAIDDKAAKEQKLIDDLFAKEKKIADELEAKEAKKLLLIVEKEAARVAKEQKIADELAAKELKKKQLEDAKLAKGAKNVIVVTNVSPVVAVAAPTTAKTVRASRIWIAGVEYMMSKDTKILYAQQTATTPAKAIGIYDDLTKSINPLPEESDDEISEDGSDDDELSEDGYDSQ